MDPSPLVSIPWLAPRPVPCLVLCAAVVLLGGCGSVEEADESSPPPAPPAVVPGAVRVDTPPAEHDVPSAPVEAPEPLPRRIVVEAYAPPVAPASDEGELSIRRFRVPDGFEIELFAAEPHMANPVAFCVDGKGRFFVAETFRHFAGVTDTRRHMYWRDDDLACRTVEDRVAMYRKHLGDAYREYGVEHDRVRLVEDTDRDGRADRATVFADGFNNVPDGIGAGVLARGDDVWYTCIPDLWLLRDTDGDGRADVKKSLSSGYGVHVGYLGHDLHGLRMGPDGRLYFTIGDRGLNVHTPDGRHLFHPDTGVVLRCEPDGSDLEVFATGLRNPQELVFDERGNLFTGENNSDSGDKARWVYLVEGGDSGWRIGFQFIERPVSRGPWNRERLWEPRFRGQAAYIVPPIANVADGPSGLTYNPGTGFPERYRGYYFLCDFRGDSSRSGIRAFTVQPRGAGFELVDEHQFLWQILATDADFGPDGALYVSDWVEGWDKTSKGRLYRLSHPSAAADPRVEEVETLLASGMARRATRQLEALLAHDDMRLRQEAQFELVDRGRADALTRVVAESDSLLARLHAVWGLGQLGRSDPEVLHAVAPLLEDQIDEVRAQAAKVLGEGRFEDALDGLTGLLRDGSLRVRFHAALAVGKLGNAESVGPLLEMLRDNDEEDAFVRHAGVVALASIGDRDALVRAAGDDAPAVRLGVLLALRRLGDASVAGFLEDPEPLLIVEAARAINDVPIDDAMPALAALTTRVDLDDAALLRAVNARFRLGGDESATALCALAAREDASEAVRLEALAALGDWETPSGLDRVLGVWRPLAPRAVAPVVTALVDHAAELLVSSSNDVRRAFVDLVGRYRIAVLAPLVRDLVSDKRAPGRLRAAALDALGAADEELLADVVTLAVVDSDMSVRVVGQRLLAKHSPDIAVEFLELALDKGSVPEKQSAFDILGGTEGAKADAILETWLDRLRVGEAPLEVQLDIVEAAARRTAPAVVEKLGAYRESLASLEPLERWASALVGGDPERGATVFYEKTEVSCVRCHRVGNRGGAVGPELTQIAAQRDRAYLLESLVTPSAKIAEGFGVALVVKKDGTIVSGILRDETETAVVLMDADGKRIVVAKEDISQRRSDGVSAMPEDLVTLLSPREVRDLVAFLAGLK